MRQVASVSVLVLMFSSLPPASLPGIRINVLPDETKLLSSAGGPLEAVLSTASYRQCSLVLFLDGRTSATDVFGVSLHNSLRKQAITVKT